MKSVGATGLSGSRGRNGPPFPPETGSESDRGAERGQCGRGRHHDDTGDDAALVGLRQFIKDIAPLQLVNFIHFVPELRPLFRQRNNLGPTGAAVIYFQAGPRNLELIKKALVSRGARGHQPCSAPSTSH